MAQTKKKQGQPAPSKIRIIAGQWRGRKLTVPNELGLRPTGDRLRETLFNWLAPYIEGARCLDAYAGTGALGLEALSRGAEQVQFIESNGRTASQLQNNLQLLQTNQANVAHGSCIDWLKSNSPQPYDLIFLDPPFAENLWQSTIDALCEHQLLRPNALIYIEMPRQHLLQTPSQWRNIKQKDSGQVSARLYEYDVHMTHNETI
ncbi:Ribosomal RNA small subunit methyltransferase D [Thalassocella blandensis]|nr:Ribosomal RNA small subunit methyltransferase D [Thalassocella blandensis]